MNLAEIRAKYPQYKDLSDEALARGLHEKNYSDMPFGEFAQKIGAPKLAAAEAAKGVATETGALEAIGVSAGRGLDRLAAGLRHGVQSIPGVGPSIAGFIDKADTARGVTPPSTARAVQDENTRLYEPLEEEQGAATFAGAFPQAVAAKTPLGMAAIGALEYGTPQERATRAAIGYGGGKVGQKVGDVLTDRAATKAADLAVQKSQNSVRDATTKSAQEAGYVFPPSQVSPSIGNRIAEGFAGKLTTAQSAAGKNQSVTNNLVRKELGLADDVPLAKETFQAVRNEASKAYDAVKAIGTVEADRGYAKALDDIATRYDKSHGGMAALRNPEVEGLLKDAAKPALDSENIVAFLRNLREQGFANKAFGQPAKNIDLGKTQLGIANAIEDMVERKLGNLGQPEVLTNFREARKLIAKSFTAEKALNPATGNIQSSKLAEMFRKGKPLSGGMLQAGKTGAAFPAATKEITTSMPGISPLDWFGGMVASGATGNPLGMAAPLARPAVRAGILSGPYQKAMVNPSSYELGLLGKALPKMKEKDLFRILGGAGGLLGLDLAQ